MLLVFQLARLLKIWKKNTIVWYGMVNVDLYSAIITKVSNALYTLYTEKQVILHSYCGVTINNSAGKVSRRTRKYDFQNVRTYEFVEHCSAQHC